MNLGYRDVNLTWEKSIDTILGRFQAREIIDKTLLFDGGSNRVAVLACQEMFCIYFTSKSRAGDAVG